VLPFTNNVTIQFRCGAGYLICLHLIKKLDLKDFQLFNSNFIFEEKIETGESTIQKAPADTGKYTFI
jgi:hypothetical protein